MALRIGDYKMSSSRSRHTARLAPGSQYTWEASWLPGRPLNRDEAITAMVIADTTADSAPHPGHRAWPHLQGWAAELGMTAPQALDHAAGPLQPPRVPGPRVVPLDPDPVMLGWIEDPDPIDLQLTGAPETELPEPEYPDPCWPGFGHGPRPAPPYLSDLAVSDWHQERQPGNPANGRHASHADCGIQPAHEPDKLPDWEAGQ